jgi:hypothetical protein
MAAPAANLQQNFAFKLRFESGLKVKQKCPTSPLFKSPPLFLLFLQEIISGRPSLRRRNARLPAAW